MATSLATTISDAVSRPIRICVTCGDPNGVGLEVFLKALLRIASAPDHELRSPENARIALFAPPELLWRYVEMLRRAQPELLRDNGNVAFSRLPEGGGGFRIGELVCDVAWNAEIARQTSDGGENSLPQFGEETLEGGCVAFASLRASALALRHNEADAVCTMPVSKRALQMAGFAFPGQTEFYGDAFPSDAPPTMILATEAAALDAERAPVRVGLATVHIPLRQVAAALNSGLIVQRLEAFSASLRQDFGASSPRIAVLGLNPHAGEQGILGEEEQTVIEPAIAEARARGIFAEGAFPADGFFARGEYRRFDGILAMYHDQGLIPLKLLAGAGGVNFTAGLSVTRVSPDHGTAFGIAGRGVADEQSALEALETAYRVARRRRES